MAGKTRSRELRKLIMGVYQRESITCAQFTFSFFIHVQPHPNDGAVHIQGWADLFRETFLETSSLTYLVMCFHGDSV